MDTKIFVEQIFDHHFVVSGLEGIVTVSLALNLKYNYSIVEVSARVQEKVKNAIENMTGLEVADVNIKVAGVEMESQE